jgi:hypothetical protein
MKLTIINDDNLIGIDGISIGNLDLSATGIPENVHALQWKVNLGWIEYKLIDDFKKPENEVINTLPAWANNCVTIFNTKMNEIKNQQAQNNLPTE